MLINAKLFELFLLNIPWVYMAIIIQMTRCSQSYIISAEIAKIGNMF